MYWSARNKQELEKLVKEWRNRSQNQNDRCKDRIRNGKDIKNKDRQIKAGRPERDKEG